MSKVWSTVVELDFPIEEADIKPIFDDDDLIDYMGRAHRRLQDIMGKMKKDGAITHFRIRKVPHLHPPEIE